MSRISLEHVRQLWRPLLQVAAWGAALVWCVRTHTLLTRLDEVPDLSGPEWDDGPAGSPELVVIVPAKDEETTIRPAMETLLAQDYPALKILAVNDRSADQTGAILDELASRQPDRLTVLHLHETVEGWLGKVFAMESAVRQSDSRWILFTDADIWFSPSLLRRAMAFAETSRADHLVVAPTVITRSWGEKVILGFLSIFALWASRPWRVADATARRDVVGAGAFNMIRRDALEELGGLAPERLTIIEDVALGARVRAAGMRQRLAFAPGLVLVHWAPGAWGLIRGLTKNLFAAVGFQVIPAAGFLFAVTAIFLAPVAGLFWWATLVPSAFILVCVAAQYRIMAEITGIAARWGWLYPLGACALLWAMVRSAALTLWRGGVRWRATFYSLDELRPHNDLRAWEREAAREHAQRRRALRGLQPQSWKRILGRTQPAHRRLPQTKRPKG